MSDDGKVTPLKPTETPAEVAGKIMGETVALRDLAGSLPRIAAELARSNALAAETIRLQQLQLQQTQRVIDLLAGQMANGPQVQMHMLDKFGDMFAPIMEMMNRSAAKPAQITSEPAEREPVSHDGKGFRVEGDPNEATPREE